MTKRIHLQSPERAAEHRRSLWPLIILGAAAGAAWSWVDPDGTSHAAAESLQLLHAFMQQGLDPILHNFRPLT